MARHPRRSVMPLAVPLALLARPGVLRPELQPAGGVVPVRPAAAEVGGLVRFPAR
jgi:hypothetical protein